MNHEEVPSELIDLGERVWLDRVGVAAAPRDHLAALLAAVLPAVRIAERAEAMAEVARLRAGEDPTPRDPGIQRTAGQWIYEWNQAPEDRRMQMIEFLLNQAHAASDCFVMDHVGRLEDARGQVAIVREQVAQEIESIFVLARRDMDPSEAKAEAYRAAAKVARGESP